MFVQKYSLDELKMMDFGLLKVIDEVEPKIYKYNNVEKKARMMKCVCKCGNENVVVSLNNLLRHHTVSCGCYKNRYNKQFLNNYKGERIEKVV